MSQLIEDDKRANRLARTIASDILVYNREAVEKGILEDDLFERLAEQIEKGQEHYESRVSGPVRGKSNYFNRTLVDILLKGQEHIPGRAW